MDIRELTCINCPMGCRITVTMDGDSIVSVEGNTCKRGENYARAEVTSPVRTVTTTIKVNNGASDRVSCKTKEPVPKEKIFDVMAEIRALSDAVEPLVAAELWPYPSYTDLFKIEDF